jgi:integral membrane protein (TIGR00529 family)
VGGAYFSAPMVDEATKDIRMSPEEKGFINYWYRHPWEYILSLYPGLLLASALTNLELRSLIMANMTYAVLMLVTGFMFSMKRLSGRIQEHEKSFPHATAKKALNDRIWSFVPIALVLISVGIFDVQLHYALGAIVTGLFVFYKFSFKEILRALKYGFALEIIVLIIGIMLFKFTLENSGAVVQLSRFFSENNIPLLPMLVLLPFVCGLLTGLSVGFVGSAFPLLVSISGGGHLDQISLAFAAGTLGVLLSPVHVCLILTREYFKADAWGIYKKIFPSAGIIMGAAFVQYFFF